MSIDNSSERGEDKQVTQEHLAEVERQLNQATDDQLTHVERLFVAIVLRVFAITGVIVLGIVLAGAIGAIGPTGIVGVLGAVDFAVRFVSIPMVVLTLVALVLIAWNRL